MTAARGTVATAEHDMRVGLGFSLLHRDIAGEHQDLHLFVNRQLAIAFCLPIEIRQPSGAESADARESRRLDLFARREVAQARHHLVARFEDQSMNTASGPRKWLRFHLRWRFGPSNAPFAPHHPAVT